MTIPDAAIEAAAEALWADFVEGDGDYLNFSDYTKEDQDYWRHDARTAIEAAMPAIREAIAQEIEAIPYSPELEHGDNGEWMQVEAARTARAAK